MEVPLSTPETHTVDGAVRVEVDDLDTVLALALVLNF